MHAIRLHEFGPATNLILDELPDLEPAPGEVRIAVEAAGVHLLDTSLRQGEPGPVPPPELPTIPGREVAGVVDALGSGVDESWRDRRVVAHLGMVPGGYATQATTSVANLFQVPDHVDAASAVAAVGTGRTALGILETEPIRPDDVVLVPSAAGGLGWLLVQTAKTVGATVVAAAGGQAKLDRLAELKPDVAVDYDAPDWPERVRDQLGERGVTVVYDGVGGAVGRAALELLAPGGRMVMFGYSAGTPTQFDASDVLARSLSVSWALGPRMFALPGGIPGLAGRALQRVADGEWRPLVTTYPLADAASAHAALESRAAVGKVVLLTSASTSMTPRRRCRSIRADCRGSAIMTDIPEAIMTTRGDDPVASIDERSLAPEPRGPRALRPFRTPAYRKLALALILSTFASGVWVVALVWEVIRIGGGPAQLSIVSTASAVGVLLPALLAGVWRTGSRRRRSCSAWPPSSSAACCWWRSCPCPT